ncbi:thiamine-phosphate pyrophosphorylase [Propionibacterium cyclohexanicum]|uniref:Thiamine-phosphate pyrophosphorylase n=1 Tax=Propionibacterium cyclohexanicum TaxID=64702 RepID=A0A1H9SQ54_9ACTN|nr:thiamine phosphate synthase [Propionibacterium cyclohexanicum]SER86543.1 thiamine-phosphate pyrophosphorylase [Propionibacterium cyclohexanicum]
MDDRADVAFAAMRRDIGPWGTTAEAVAMDSVRPGAPADGVPLGATDLPVRDAREMLGPDAIIGFTTGSAGLGRDAQRDAVVIDHLGAGPIHPTPTKDSRRAPRGTTGHPELVRARSLPTVAIGDMTPPDLPELTRTAIAGVAMVRAIIPAADPRAVLGSMLGCSAPNVAPCQTAGGDSPRNRV